MPTEMEMMVAKALWEHEGGDSGIHDSGRCGVEDYVALARTAIQAMRAPTETMIATGVVVDDDMDTEPSELAVHLIWRAMIDTASPAEDPCT